MTVYFGYPVQIPTARGDLPTCCDRLREYVADEGFEA